MELRVLRQIARLTQRQLGELAGIDDSTISAVEGGRRDLGEMAYFSVVRVGRALAPGVPIEKLFPVPHEPFEVRRPPVAELPPANSREGA